MSDPAEIYHARWFDKQQERSARSAAVVVPIILSMVPDIRSVVDVGCGAGTWLAQFKARDVATIKGYDGGAADPSQMHIPAECFERTDLTELPFVTRRYDLAVCLEVGEHLPAASAPKLVKFLTDLSDVVLFSAALPGQGGRNHINEQPLSYWRKMFAEEEYDFWDVVRPRLWDDDRVEWWYRQNMVLAIKRGAPVTVGARPVADGDLIDIVHPGLLAHTIRTSRKRPSKLKSWLRRLSGRATA